MANFFDDGEDDPRFHQPDIEPPPANDVFEATGRPEGGRDPGGNYVPNPVIPGAPDTYWDQDQQRPIPQGTTAPPPTGGNTGTGGGGGGGWDAAAAERAIRDQYQRVFGRAPQGNELATDLEAARRYGLTSSGPTGGVLGQIAARGNNRPGTGILGSPTGRPTGPGPGTTTGGYGGGGGGVGGAGDMGTGNANMDRLLQTLMERITGGQGGQPVSYTSPLRDQVLAELQSLIAQGSKPMGDVSQTPEALAYRTALDRGAADTRSALMERRAAQGLNVGGQNIDTDVLGINQEKALAQAQYEGKLSHDLLMDKKDRLERALNLGAGIISDEQRAFAQQQLSQVNSALALFQALQSNQYNYDYLGYLLGSQEAGANERAANPGG